MQTVTFLFNFNKKWLRHRCIPMAYAMFLRTLILQYTSKRLHLFFQKWWRKKTFRLISKMSFTNVDITVVKPNFDNRIRFPCFCYFVPPFLLQNFFKMRWSHSKCAYDFTVSAHTIRFNSTIWPNLPRTFSNFFTSYIENSKCYFKL